MRRRWKILVLSACSLIAAVGVCFFGLHDTEPSYQGRTLSEWLDNYSKTYVRGQTNAPKQQAAVTAVQAIGTNAVPFLLNWCFATDSVVHGLIDHASNRLSGNFRVRMYEYLWMSGAQRKRHNAFNGFRILRTNAIAALPELARRFRVTEDEYDALDEAMCISQIGTNGLAVLLETIRNPPSQMHFLTALHAFRAIDYLGTNAAPAVPDLKRLLNDRDPVVVTAASKALQQIVPDVLTNNAVRGNN